MQRYNWPAHLLFLSLATTNFAQRISINGTIFSFKGEKLMLIKKAQKNVSFDGSLEGVKLEVTGNNFQQTITTGLSGYFSLKLDSPGEYQVKVNRSGYSTIEFNINYRNAGERNRYESLFLVLKQDDQSRLKMGTISHLKLQILNHV